MKKRILSILTILGIGVSFCSADFSYYPYSAITFYPNSSSSGNFGCFRVSNISCVRNFEVFSSSGLLLFGSGQNYNANSLFCGLSSDMYIHNYYTSNCTYYFYDISISSSSSSCPDMLIDVKYNSGNTSTITCDGINYITIDGLSTLTNSNTNYEYSPYFNIDYTDEDNQLLTESYSKNILYLSGGKFKKTYTGDNEWVLNNLGIGSEGNNITYTPVFDVTGTTDVLNTGNVFNNWSDNALKVLLSNVPGYIQYITIFAILLFLFGFLRRFKRKR